MEQTLNELFQDSMTRYAERPAIAGRTREGYKAVTYGELNRQVRTFLSGLLILGLRKGDHVAVLAENRTEWAITDIGLMHLGAVSVAIFPTLPAAQVEYILMDSGSRLILLSDKIQLQKALQVKEKLPDLKIVTMDTIPDAPEGTLSFEELMKMGEASLIPENVYEQTWKAVKPYDWASLIYTSGTTGEPKGVILTHHNFSSNIMAGKAVITFKPGDVLLSFVPLNHVMGRMTDHYLPLTAGSMVAYVENLRRLRQNLLEVKPHLLVLVPRVLEMFREGLLGNIQKEKASVRKLFFWALSTGRECTRLLQEGKQVPRLMDLKWRLADKLVFSKIRKRLGLERLHLFFSGGAAMPRQTAEFFFAMKLPIMEGYGLSETSPLVAVNPQTRLKIGTVGLPVEGVDVRIAEDGEILVRGPNVMQGYYNKSKETAEVIDHEGWFHTGDVGKFDDEGYLSITDRKKNLLVLNNGKNVAPQPIETRLLESPYINQVLLVGDRRNTVTALIVPSLLHLQEWAATNGIVVESEHLQAFTSRLEVIRLIRQEVDRLSEGLAEYEKIRRFTLLDEDFSVENGMLTPTLKVRRSRVMGRYKETVESMYRPGGDRET
jgi:long-chain acyl-CoA synthetase